MNYLMIHQLLEALEKFESDADRKKNASLDVFLDWMVKDRVQTPLQYKAPPLSDDAEVIPLQGGTNAQITQLVVLMYKYIRYYLRKALHDSQLHNPDDFGFLATLIFYGDMQKGELIQRNTSELTSGMEVLKRLEKNSFIRAFDDPNDQRARRVAATDAGIEAFAAVMPTMQQIGVLAMGNLSGEEQQQLFVLLQKLHDFHQPIFHQSKKEDWAAIATKFLDTK